MMPVFLGLTAALLALALVIGQTVLAQREARSRAMAEGDTLLALQAVMRTMLEAETGQRGYLLTADQPYLEPYLRAKRRLGPAIAQLRDIAKRSGDGASQDRADWIAALTEAKFAEMDRTVTLTRNGMPSAALAIVQSDFGKRQMDSIRDAITRESLDKARLRREAFARADTLEERLLPLIAILGIAIIALVVAGFRAERGRAEAEVEAEQAAALREANERIQLLARELNHRVKNLFSVILSIVTLSGRKQTSSDELVENIRARIHALSLAHSYSQGSETLANVALGLIIANTMAPYADDEARRVRVDGPEIDLPVRMVTPIGLIIHELATNAAKYGALSVDDGTVEISWQVRADDGGSRELLLSWIETGGPALTSASGAASNAGFGTRMTSLAAGQLGGSIVREWPATGAVVKLSFRLPTD